MVHEVFDIYDTLYLILDHFPGKEIVKWQYRLVSKLWNEVIEDIVQRRKRECKKIRKLCKNSLHFSNADCVRCVTEKYEGILKYTRNLESHRKRIVFGLRRFRCRGESKVFYLTWDYTQQLKKCPALVTKDSIDPLLENTLYDELPEIYKKVIGVALCEQYKCDYTCQPLEFTEKKNGIIYIDSWTGMSNIKVYGATYAELYHRGEKIATLEHDAINSYHFLPGITDETPILTKHYNSFQIKTDGDKVTLHNILYDMRCQRDIYESLFEGYQNMIVGDKMLIYFGLGYFTDIDLRDIEWLD